MATSLSTGFSSVKLPAALVQQAREAAQPMRRSVAGQVEYWATLGRIVEHSGLTAQEAQAAIETYEAAARAAQKTRIVADLTSRLLAAESSGSLAQRVREGGHPVPPDRILARYPRTMAHLAQAVQWAHVAYLYDAHDIEHGGPRLVAVATPAGVTVVDAPLPAWAQRMLEPGSASA